MIIKGVSLIELGRIAGGLTLELYNERKSGTGVAFRVIPRSATARYSRRTARGRRLAATCYHGFRDFVTQAFEAGALAVSTAGPRHKNVTYRSLTDFERDLQAFADMNIGSIATPVRMIDTCDCASNNGRV